MITRSSSVVPIPPSLSRRFYEPIKIEEALVEVFRKSPNYAGKLSHGTEVNFGHDDDDEQAFRSSLNKFAHVCDARKGGDTVSAVAVTFEYDCVRWFIASNARGFTDHDALEAFFEELLSISKGAESNTRVTETPQFLVALQHIVVFNELRIHFYVKSLHEMLQRILCDDSSASHLRSGDRTTAALKYTLELISSQIFPYVKQDGFSLGSVLLIRFLQKAFGRGSIATTLTRQCNESKHNPFSVWLQIRHLISRLRAYYISAETIVASLQRWPELAENFNITIVPSSRPEVSPIKLNCSSVYAAISRFTCDSEKRQQCLEEVNQLEKFGISELFQSVWTKGTFRPLVHAEILVHKAVKEYLYHHREFEFWRGWRFIGSSKPTCRLCSYYFQQVNDVTVRETHHNLYTNWRLPDCFSQSEANYRRDLLNQIVQRTRADAIRVIQDKLPRGRRNDSSSNPIVSRWFGNSAPRTLASISELSDMLDNVRLSDPVQKSSRVPVASTGGSLHSQCYAQALKEPHMNEVKDTVGEEDVREDGGVLLN